MKLYSGCLKTLIFYAHKGLVSKRFSLEEFIDSYHTIYIIIITIATENQNVYDYNMEKRRKIVEKDGANFIKEG